MSNYNKILCDITALIDHEITNEIEVGELKGLIINDPVVRNEYHIQKTVKEVLRRKSTKICCPAELKEKITIALKSYK